jgi:hypothetical protein
MNIKRSSAMEKLSTIKSKPFKGKHTVIGIKSFLD